MFYFQGWQSPEVWYSSPSPWGKRPLSKPIGSTFAKDKAGFWSSFWRNKDRIQQKCYLVIEKSLGRTKGFEKMKMLVKRQGDAAGEEITSVLN